MFAGVSRRIGVGNVANRNLARGGIAVYETAPGFMSLVDDLHGILLVFSFTGEGELVLRLAVGDLVDPEPFIGRPDETGQVTLDILDIIQLGSKRVGNVYDDDLPVCFTLVEEGHDTENFDLFNLTGVTDLFADLANIKGIVVTLGLGFGVSVIGVFPGLREGAIVPNVTVVGEAVTNEAQTTLLDVLFDGIERLLLRDLELGVGPTGDLYNHVEDAIALIGKERNVVEGGNDLSDVFRVDAMFESVGSTNDTNGV